jgi:TetR/AcrR family transcriptional regulator
MDARQGILETATRLFAAHGFDGTSLQDIADEVGIRKASLLYHFNSKEKLRLAVLDRLLDHWNDVLPKLFMASVGGEPRFGTIIKALVDFFADDPDRARLLVREILDRPDDMKVRIETHVRPWVSVVAGYIRGGQDQGEVYANVDPEAYVLQVINMVVSGVATASSLAGALLPDASADQKLSPRHGQELVRIARYSLFSQLSRVERNNPKQEPVARRDTADGEPASARPESNA